MIDLQEGGGSTNLIKGPIYVYYQLDNFYQNHRRYVKSRDNEQLFGTFKDAGELSTCDPIVNNTQLWPDQQYSNKTKKDVEDHNAEVVRSGSGSIVILNPDLDQSPDYPKLKEL